MHDLSALLAIARDTAESGAKLLRESTPSTISAKSDRDLVTDIDIRIQNLIKNELNRRTPGFLFIGEEEEASTEFFNNSPTWTLDPIDGTSNYIHRLPMCGISLALVYSGKPIIGVVNLPFLDLEYYAAEGFGAFLNDEMIGPRNSTHLNQSIISIGDYAVGEGAASRNAIRLEITKLLTARAERVRMFGSAALDLAWVADGRIDGCVIMSNHPWDTAAGVVIARESGAVVTDSDGTPHSFESRHTVASANPIVAQEIANLISDAHRQSETQK